MNSRHSLAYSMFETIAQSLHTSVLLFPEPSVMMFKKGTQNFTTFDPTYIIPVVRTRNQDIPATVKWRTKRAQRFELSGPLKFGPGESEKNIMIDPRTHPGPVQPENFQLELFEPGTNTVIGERKTTLVNVTDGGKSGMERPSHVTNFTNAERLIA